MLDPRGKPTYVKDQCETCAGWRAQRSESPGPVCNECGCQIPEYKNMTDGYQAQTIDHWHFQMISGMMGLSVVKKTLCRECYRLDWAEVYPDLECPV